MAQVIASAATSAASQIVAGRQSATAASSGWAQPQRIVMNVRQPFGKQQRRSRVAAVRPQAFCGPQFGMGMGPMGGRANFNMSPAEIHNMVQEFEKLMGGSAPGGSGFSPGGDAADREAYRYVPVDVTEESDAYTFTADLPGVARSDTKVQANKEKRELTISGSRAAPQLSDEQKQLRRKTERKFGMFKRTFKLPEDADLSKITARFNNGVLAVSINRTKPAEPTVNDVPIDDWLSSGEQA